MIVCPRLSEIGKFEAAAFQAVICACVKPRKDDASEARDWRLAVCNGERLFIGTILLRITAPPLFRAKVVAAIVPLTSETIAPGVNFAMIQGLIKIYSSNITHKSHTNIQLVDFSSNSTSPHSRCYNVLSAKSGRTGGTGGHCGGPVPTEGCGKQQRPCALLIRPPQVIRGAWECRGIGCEASERQLV